MGLLSDPSIGRRHKLGRTLLRHSNKVSFVLYAAGLVWFVFLAHANFNHGTYLSENALSPGLVYPEIRDDSSRLAHSLHEEIKREHQTHKSSTPHAWIMAKMKQIGLETHVHNFTLRYPFGAGKEYHGKNVYGILRAPRIGSTEGVVFSAPYRPPSSVHTEISASVPTLLAFAEFARKKNYWAKDLVFLVTEQEQLGVHAWLQAYHEADTGDQSVLRCGSLPARAGALQAAINLEIQDLFIDYIDVKIEGLNGQLPNLDLFNLVQRIASREGISSGYKQTPRKKSRTSSKNVEQNLRHMTSMLLSQASGIPNGNHGLFHRFRVEALTLEAVKKRQPRTPPDSYQRNVAALPLLKTLEGISRSLNNLLERFHQSFFFYILVQNDRFISIGDFMPCLALVASPLFVRAFLLWLSLDDGDGDEPEEGAKDSSESVEEPKRDHRAPLYGSILVFIGCSISLGFICSAISSNQFVRDSISKLDVNVSTGIGLLLMGVTIVSLVTPLLINPPQGNFLLLPTLTLHGVALITLGLLNFAFGFLVALATVPLALFICAQERNRSLCRPLFSAPFTIAYALLLHPFVLNYLCVLGLTVLQFPEMQMKEWIFRSFTAAMDAISFAVMDSIIYNNRLYTIVTLVFLPLWTLYWSLAVQRKQSKEKSA